MSACYGLSGLGALEAYASPRYFRCPRDNQFVNGLDGFVTARRPNIPRKRLSDVPERTRLFGIWKATETHLDADALASYVATPRHISKSLGSKSSSLSFRDASKSSHRMPSRSPSKTDASPMSSNQADTSTSSILNFVVESAEYAEKFRAACRGKYVTMVRAWRLLLDPGGNGRVSFGQFCTAARTIGFERVSTLWSVFDIHKSGFITLDCWDQQAFIALMEFRNIAKKQYGGMREAFRFGMDRCGSAACHRKDFEAFCDDMEFTGDTEVLFQALDKNQRGFIVADDLDFLSRWEGERFRPANVDRAFNFGLARLRIAQRKQRENNERFVIHRERTEENQQSLVAGLEKSKSLLSSSTSFSARKTAELLMSLERGATPSPSDKGEGIEADHLEAADVLNDLLGSIKDGVLEAERVRSVSSDQ